MAAIILDGNRISANIRAELTAEAAALSVRGIRPGLAAVLVGNDPASEIYVRNKVKASAQVGLHSEQIALPSTITTDELLRVVADLNHRDDIDGILVQLPLPTQVDSSEFSRRKSPPKIVDGFIPSTSECSQPCALA